MGNQYFGHPVGPELVGCPAEGQGVGLARQVGDEQVGGRPGPWVVGGRSGHTDEFHGDDVSSLVEELEEGVLRVGAGRPPDDCPSGRLRGGAVMAHPLAEALHRELLQPGDEQAEPVGVGNHSYRPPTEVAVVPDVYQCEQDSRILLHR